MVGIINYREGKALILDTYDLIALDGRFETQKETQENIWDMIETARHETDYTLIVTSRKFLSLPKRLRDEFMEKEFNMVPCYRFINRKEESKCRK